MIRSTLHTLSGTKPVVVTALSGVNTVALLEVWRDSIHEWAAVFTLLLGVPTAILILCYWGIKVKMLWKEYRTRRRY
jgi:hypothetical protein